NRWVASQKALDRGGSAADRESNVPNLEAKQEAGPRIPRDGRRRYHEPADEGGKRCVTTRGQSARRCVTTTALTVRKTTFETRLYGVVNRMPSNGSRMATAARRSREIAIRATKKPSFPRAIPR